MLPLSSSEFDELMAAVGFSETSKTLAVALSGGADSLALTLLTHTWAKERGSKLIALTVDHGLRAEAANEAAAIHRWCEGLGIEHKTLVWQHDAHPTSAIQASARDARYGLLSDFCNAHHIQNLLVAHHRDDQTETLFFRLARGSGLDGLACMQPITPLNNIRLIRPLLPIPKARLVATLRAHGQPWIEDPSNQNSNFTRIRIRKLLQEYGQQEAISARAYALTQSFAKFRNLLENKLASELTNCIIVQEDGHLTLNANHFANTAPDYQLRILAYIATSLGGQEHKPRSEKQTRFLAQLLSDIAGAKTIQRTFGGCLFRITPKNAQIIIIRH